MSFYVSNLLDLFKEIKGNFTISHTTVINHAVFQGFYKFYVKFGATNLTYDNNIVGKNLLHFAAIIKI